MKETKTITKCECGSDEFYIFEDILHFTQLDSEGNLSTYDRELEKMQDSTWYIAHCDLSKNTVDNLKTMMTILSDNRIQFD